MDVNLAFADMLGYSREEIIDKTVSGVTHPDEVPMTVEDRRRIVDEGRHMDTLKKYSSARAAVIFGGC